MTSSKKEVLNTFGPITILEVFTILENKEDKNPRKTLLSYLEEQIGKKKRTIRKDTAVILEGRKFSPQEIPILANREALPSY